MNKATLIVLESYNEKFSGFGKILRKMVGPFEALIPNKIENIVLQDEDFTLNIVQIPKMAVECGRLEARLERLSKWFQKEEIGLVAIDEYIENNPALELIIKKSGAEVSYGSNVFFSFEIRTLKKLFKSKGLDISDIDTVIVSDGSSKYETGYIKYFSPFAKYLTYVSSNINIKELIDDIFNNFGFSIRVCSNIKDCIGEAGLVINLTKDEVIPKGTKLKSELIVRNVANSLSSSRSSLTVLNEINIDISSKFKIHTDIKNKYKYRICEQYILSKLGKLYLLKKVAEENDLKEIYDCIKNEGFKIIGLDGKNI